MNFIRARTHNEPHADASESRLNWLRAAVLGANDGIVSIGALVVGIAGATNEIGVIFATGIAGLLAGALSMALGEYVSVSAQRDTERALLAKERQELASDPAKELEELIGLYQAKGLSRATATEVAKEFSARDVFAAHAEIELHIDPDKLVNPWQAAFASAASFFVGALIPLITIVAPPVDLRIPLTFAATIVALAITGTWSASVGDAGKLRAALRVVIGGTLALGITYGVGILFGVSGI